MQNDKKKMFSLAEPSGNLLNAFAGEHAGEDSPLICLFDNPHYHRVSIQ